MRFSNRRKAASILAALALTCAAAGASPQEQRKLPNPTIYLRGTDTYQNGGKEFTRYLIGVDNFAAYPDEMFAASPQLPPCGNNAKASRTWVDIYAQDGKRLYGFCGLAKASDLKDLWFALEAGAVPPSWVYIELNDRATNTKYKSNLADTTP